MMQKEYNGAAAFGLKATAPYGKLRSFPIVCILYHTILENQFGDSSLTLDYNISGTQNIIECFHLNVFLLPIVGHPEAPFTSSTSTWHPPSQGLRYNRPQYCLFQIP